MRFLILFVRLFLKGNMFCAMHDHFQYCFCKLHFVSSFSHSVRFNLCVLEWHIVVAIIAVHVAAESLVGRRQVFSYKCRAVVHAGWQVAKR